ncbi:machado-joseph disease protein, putative [Eimeria brunetti]|uniref:Machado-joseph disease protein, putative n=1 Tax=Eimeria brunetti TaxID=51314 RepID=U6LWA5_9EIME|nr:machado-joseph disease protein, putative [Eimeria brunetti]
MNILLNPEAAAAAATAAAANGEDIPDAAEDPELAEAIRLSMECYKKEVAQPPEEPAADEEGIKFVFIRLPSGKRLSRRFKHNAEIKQISRWLFYESQNKEGLPPLTPLSSFSLVQTFPRRRFCWLNNKMLLFLPPDAEGVDVTETSLEELGFQAQEQLMMQITNK